MSFLFSFLRVGAVTELRALHVTNILDSHSLLSTQLPNEDLSVCGFCV